MTKICGYGAAVLDAADGRRTVPWRRALLATLVCAGLRIDECLSLRWRDVELPNRRLRVRGTKTAVAFRTVAMLPVLRDELLAYAAGVGDRDPDGLVFPTIQAGARYDSAGKHSPSNIRTRCSRRPSKRPTRRSPATAASRCRKARASSWAMREDQRVSTPVLSRRA
jgi:integrase